MEGTRTSEFSCWVLYLKAAYGRNEEMQSNCSCHPANIRLELFFDIFVSCRNTSYTIRQDVSELAVHESWFAYMWLKLEIVQTKR